jgi:hypothetical protein
MGVANREVDQRLEKAKFNIRTSQKSPDQKVKTDELFLMCLPGSLGMRFLAKS